ncbi:NaeI family type II restriction endonuclease [Shewanella algae]|uniref:NaeI family type II restriction endonuclease n=1 Tax=Shewanella algae TaxID=38313 RepID=UPI003D7EB6E3
MKDMRSIGYIDSYLQEHPNNLELVGIATSLIEQVGSVDQFLSLMGQSVRKAIDEVIDMPRTQRYSIEQLEKTEKTYIGTKVEILIRHNLSLPKGKQLDLSVNGHDVDVKNTIGSSWMIPQEAINQYCLLIQSNDKKGILSVGLVFCSLKTVSEGMNRDQKRSIGAGNNAIFWIGRKCTMPANFFEMLSPSVLNAIIDTKAKGAERVRRLCRLVPNTPFSRYIVECVAQQKDPMKRLRKNGGARDSLIKENIHILGAKYDREKLEKLGFTNLSEDDWVAVHPCLLPREGS